MIEKESVMANVELLRNKRQRLYLEAVCECPHWFCDKHKTNTGLHSTHNYLSNTSKEECYELEYFLHFVNSFTYCDVEIDCRASKNYFICKCLKCGAKWQVSKRKLEKEAKKLDNQVAKAEGEKFVWLKRNKDYILPFLIGVLILFGAVPTLIWGLVLLFI